MNLLTTLPFLKWAAKGPRQISSESWEERDVILKPEVNLFLWKRDVTSEIQGYLQSLAACESFKFEVPVSLENLEFSLSEMAKVIPHKDGMKAFLQDVFMITGDFLNYSEKGSGRLHFRVVRDDACTKFHTDGYTLRLFTTYLGRGTEWLPESAVNRKGLGKSNYQIVKDPSKVQRMAPLEVGILKGEVPGRKTAGRGIVHRSPQISHLGEKRIILRVDI